jgi:hypothetical protein
MKLEFLILPALLLSHGAYAVPTYTTSTGAVFTQVQVEGSDISWKAPDGLTWTIPFEGTVTNAGPQQDGYVISSPATDACKKVHAELPTRTNFESLISDFEIVIDGSHFTDQGLRDLYYLFPNMRNRWFWSTALLSDCTTNSYACNFSYMFCGCGGDLGAWSFYEYRWHSQSVICVIRDTKS